MFERVYLGPHTRSQHEHARDVIGRIFDHLVEQGEPADRVADYTAGMTDRFALAYAEEI
jgi:dGTP triphosphohydrolase